MNPSKLFEIAICNMLRQAELGAGVVLRPWQSLRLDGSWSEEIDYQFPYVDIRFSPEVVDSDQVTCTCNGSIMAATLTEDDKDHEKISALYEAVYIVINGIFRSFISGSGTLYADFLTQISEIDSTVLDVGGITLEGSNAPYDDNGSNRIGIGISIHFSYK